MPEEIRTNNRDLPLWELLRGEGPVLAVALHSGHHVRPDVERHLALSPTERLREQDPYTDLWTPVGDSALAVRRSRFEVDLNRPRDQAVYLEPEHAWGLEVWSEPPPEEVVESSLALYDAFYTEIEAVLRTLESRFGAFVVFDLHSYNHRRGGPEAPPEDPGENPEVNLGTGSLDRDRWGSVADRLLAELRQADFLGRRLDVRENVRFRGGWFSRWVHETFPETGCALAIEWKKFFMDEWTGYVDLSAVAAIHRTLDVAVEGVREELARMERAA